MWKVLNFLLLVLAGLQEIVEAGAGLREIVEAGAGLPELAEAGAGLPEIIGARAGLLIFGGQVNSLVRIRDE